MELAGRRPFLLEVIATLLMGGLVIMLIEITRGAGRGWSWGQRLVLVCSLLFIGGRGLRCPDKIGQSRIKQPEQFSNTSC